MARYLTLLNVCYTIENVWYNYCTVLLKIHAVRQANTRGGLRSLDHLLNAGISAIQQHQRGKGTKNNFLV